MSENQVSSPELNIKSTVGELSLHDNSMDINAKVYEAESLFTSHPMLPGILLYEKKKYVGMISRKAFYETFSKPYRYDLYSGRALQFLYEGMTNIEWLVIPSTLEIVEALRKALAHSKHNLDDPVIVTYENGTVKILDMYQLILANSNINLLAMKAYKEANDLKSEMLSIAAHDLKNPLNAALGLTKLIRADLDPNNPESMENIDYLDISLSNMLTLILDLLNSSVIEAGKLKLNMQIIDLVELMAAISYQNQPNASKKSQMLEFNYDREKVHLIKGDMLKIREAIENLVSNAIKYSPLNSQISIGINKIHDYCQIFVKDSGPGFTNDDLEKLFGKFQRLSAQPTGGESSSGLGLYISKQIVELHRGKIYVESKHGKGSTFYIEIPSIEEVYE
jgi:signal transduction histidine kinase